MVAAVQNSFANDLQRGGVAPPLVSSGVSFLVVLKDESGWLDGGEEEDSIPHGKARLIIGQTWQMAAKDLQRRLSIMAAFRVLA